MLEHPTIDTMKELGLRAMAREYESQLETPAPYRDMLFEERLGLLLDVQVSDRKHRKLKRLSRAAGLAEPDACIEDIEYIADRKLDKKLIQTFATCAYIRENHHIILHGATGCGKTYVACALGDAACRKYLKVHYVLLSDLLNEIAVSKSIGTYKEVKKAYAAYDLLILDEWLMRPLNADASYDLLELVDACSKKGSLIICSQFDPEDWYDRIDIERDSDEGSTVADGVIDRIVHNKYDVFIEGKESMRKRHGFCYTSESGVIGHVE